jgi:thiamine pyrophosphate-dependent acetolactate synthase large subunit-like protein
MARTVADGLWEMLVAAGVRRCYGIVGDALNPGDRRAAAQWLGRLRSRAS